MIIARRAAGPVEPRIGCYVRVPFLACQSAGPLGPADGQIKNDSMMRDGLGGRSWVVPGLPLAQAPARLDPGSDPNAPPLSLERR